MRLTTREKTLLGGLAGVSLAFCAAGDSNFTNLVASGTLDVTGASTLTGNTTVGGTLGVTGALTTTGGITATTGVTLTDDRLIFTIGSCAASCTVGELCFDTDVTGELCYCVTTDTFQCIDVTTADGPKD